MASGLLRPVEQQGKRTRTGSLWALRTRQHLKPAYGFPGPGSRLQESLHAVRRGGGLGREASPRAAEDVAFFGELQRGSHTRGKGLAFAAQIACRTAAARRQWRLGWLPSLRKLPVRSSRQWRLGWLLSLCKLPVRSSRLMEVTGGSAGLGPIPTVP